MRIWEGKKVSVIQNIRKTINYSKKNGYKETIYATCERVIAKYHADYHYDEPLKAKLMQQKKEQETYTTKFSIIVPTYETKQEYLAMLIDSCLDQSYEKWELILADGSESDIVEKCVAEYQDERIRYIRLAENGGIAVNTNQALEYATGEYCGLLDHDDWLTLDALFEMAKAIESAKAEGKELVMLYSDEDKSDSKGENFFEPHFKLDFNPDMILTNNYICHFLVVKTELMQKLQLRKEYEGAQDFDLVLRIVSNLWQKEKEGIISHMDDYIVHVPKVLYHWRCHEASTAVNPQSKMYAYEAGRNALTDFVRRMGWKADVRHNKHLGFYRMAYRNGIFAHRDDVAAVGGYVVHKGKISSGLYKGQPIIYAGYMNRMDLYQNVKFLDIRNLAVNERYQSVYEEITGHAYTSTFDVPIHEQPQWLRELTAEEVSELSKKLSKQLRAKGGRLVLDPEAVCRK